MITLLVMAAYAVLLGALLVLIVASLGALREGIRQRGRIRGLLMTLGVLAASVIAIWALLV